MHLCRFYYDTFWLPGYISQQYKVGQHLGILRKNAEELLEEHRKVLTTRLLLLSRNPAHLCFSWQPTGPTESAARGPVFTPCDQSCVFVVSGGVRWLWRNLMSSKITKASTVMEISLCVNAERKPQEQMKVINESTEREKLQWSRLNGHRLAQSCNYILKLAFWKYSRVTLLYFF